MNELIDRQAAIDAILAVTGNSSVRELYEHVQEHGLSNMWSGGVNAAIDTIIAVPSAEHGLKWILCSERLPEEDSDILVTYVEKDEERIVPVNYGHGTWFDCIFNRELNPINVLAWMPLPEPYRAERRSE